MGETTEIVLSSASLKLSGQVVGCCTCQAANSVQVCLTCIVSATLQVATFSNLGSRKKFEIDRMMQKNVVTKHFQTSRLKLSSRDSDPLVLNGPHGKLGPRQCFGIEQRAERIDGNAIAVAKQCIKTPRTPPVHNTVTIIQPPITGLLGRLLTICFN